MTLSEKDLQQLAQKGITTQQFDSQLRQFATGFPYLRIQSAAAIGNGIIAPTQAQQQQYAQAWQAYRNQPGHRIVKFVPASGAASRMFKDLFAFLSASYDTPTTPFEQNFFQHIARFAFYQQLCQACLRIHGKDVPQLIADGQYKDVVAALLNADGLGYGQKPKGVLLFHSYPDGPRTPVEEHLVEAALYAAGNHQAHLHFTVSHEHKQLFADLVNKKKKAFEKQFALTFSITFSEQKPSTDTVAAQPSGEPFRQADGTILFRPGGHGALIQNLNDIPADIIFIKNIDNVVPDSLKATTVQSKQLLAGILVTLQQQIFSMLRELDAPEQPSEERLQQMALFLEQQLCVQPPTHLLQGAQLAQYLRDKLNRPLRVCGMVKNVGEPGGGPFLAYNDDQTVSPQILESSQIDQSNPEYVQMFRSGTHFNPVDLVCAVTDYKGQHFNLPDYVDHATGFISHKSKDGRELLALELPGLWNGAMSRWNTVFVEVPLATFNPVKTVNDLLRQQHQNA